MGGSQIARWCGEAIIPDERPALVEVGPGFALRAVSSGLLISAGVVTALPLARVVSAVVRRSRSRSANREPTAVRGEDSDSIPDQLPPGALSYSYWAVGFVVVAAAGWLCLWLGVREFLLGSPQLPLVTLPGVPEPAAPRPDIVNVTGLALQSIGSGLLAGAGVLVALAWLRSVHAVDPRLAGPLTGLGVMVPAAAIVFWLVRSVALADPSAVAIPVTELDSIILFGWIVIWEPDISEAMFSLIASDLAYGLIVGSAVAAIPAMLRSYPLVRESPGGAGADQNTDTGAFLEAVPGIIAALLAGGLCLSLGREVALVDPPRSVAAVLIHIQSELSEGLLIGVGMLTAVIVSLALGTLLRRVSERRSSDSAA